MMVSVFDRDLWSGLFATDEAAGLFTDQAEIDAMVLVEQNLAIEQAKLGIIPNSAGRAIDRALQDLVIDPAALGAATARAGVPVPALVSVLRQAAGEFGSYVHFGATSQDIMDTGFILRLREAHHLIVDALLELRRTLATQAERHATTVMAARTRAQIATPTTLGLRIASWLAPLDRTAQRFDQAAGRVFQVQLGGASGNLSVFGDQGPALMAALGDALALNVPDKPWHAERDGIVEYGQTLALLTSSLGKMAHDLIIMGRSEIGEVRAGTGGGSSTMPQKSNPVQAEAILALARHNSAQLSALHQAMIHGEERDAGAWAIEWLTLPGMVMATLTCLRHSLALAQSIEADPEAMRTHLDPSVLAEAAAFKLAEAMPLTEAQTALKALAQDARRNGRDLLELLASQYPDAADWQHFGQPNNHVGAAQILVERVLSHERN